MPGMLPRSISCHRRRIGGTLLLLSLFALTACSRLGAAPPASPPAPATAPASTPTSAPRATADDDTSHFSTAGWQTNFRKHSVPLAEISSGGPGKDGIPPIDQPKFVAIEAANAWLAPAEPVVAVEVGGAARAYPLQILIWHEIVNDRLGGTPVTVTYCPLCNTAIAFDRRLNGVVYDFGTTGNLRRSDLVMWDRQTESWWQQATGEAIVGELTGQRLTFLPAAIVAWQDFKRAYPSGQVLSRETGIDRRYGENPYTAYDTSPSPFLFGPEPDKRLPTFERVAGVRLNGQAVAFPFATLAERRVIQHTVGGREIVLFYQPGAVSALDHPNIAQSRAVGAVDVFEPTVAGRRLTFQADGERFRDTETGTTWDLFGRAVDGPLAGSRLTPIVHATHFWFAWAAFHPDTAVYSP